MGPQPLNMGTFSIAKAGIVLRGGVVGEALSSRVTVGVLLGLLVSKFVGVAGTSWLVVRWRIGRLPAGPGPLTMAGLAAVAGVGFTVSLFVTGLAFDPGSVLVDESKVGVLLAVTGCRRCGRGPADGGRPEAGPAGPLTAPWISAGTGG